MTCKDNHDGTCDVEYTPVKAGPYDISVKYADQHIPGKSSVAILAFLKTLYNS